MKTYKIRAINAIPTTQFTVYFNNMPQPAAGGTVVESEFDIVIPNEYKGPGKIKIFGRARNRSFQTIAYSVSFEAGPGKKNEVSFTRESREVAVTKPAKKRTSTKKKTGSAVASIKKLTDNKLKKEIQKKKSGSSFWDKLA